MSDSRLYLSAPLIQKDGARYVVNRLERSKRLFGMLALKQLPLEEDLLGVNEVQNDNLGKNILNRQPVDKNDIKVAEKCRIDQGQVEKGVKAIDWIDDRVLHISPHSNAAHTHMISLS